MNKLKNYILFILSLSLSLSAISGCNNKTTNTNPPVANTRELLEKAYVYTLPLMIMDATFITSTNTVKATSKQAPVNQFLHAEALATSEFKNVVTPNVDTIYSQMFMDLSKDAVIIEFPKTDRFCTAEIIDAYSNSIKIIDAADFENESENFIFTGKDFNEEIRNDMTEIKCPTPMMWIIVRTICNDKEDEANVHAIQAKMKSYTYSQLKAGNIDEQPDGTFDENNQFVPIERVMKMTPDEYFNRANELMKANTPTDADKALMDEIAQINVGPGLEFNLETLDKGAVEMWKDITTNIVDTTTAKSAQFIKSNGGWSYFGEPIAEFGTEYYYRAFIALVGFGANPVSVAVYPKTTLDSDGNRLNGQNNYVIHLDKEQIPTVETNGFWSITAYNSDDNFLIDNEINRYCINDRSSVKYNQDGSLDIVVSKTKPDNDISNWLPICDGDFHFVLRVYYPTENILKNNWTAPSIIKK